MSKRGFSSEYGNDTAVGLIAGYSMRRRAVQPGREEKWFCCRA